MTIKTASARDMVPQQTLDQIGRMNLMAISGFRWSMDANGDMLLPISSGYRVRISLDANDTYTVTREMKRGDKIFVKGSQSDVYAEDLGEVCYQASSYKSNDWGGHVVGAKRTAGYDDTDDFYDDHSPFGDEPGRYTDDDPTPYDIELQCDECGARATLTVRVGDESPPQCPNGHGPMRSPAFSDESQRMMSMTHPHREAQLLEALEYATTSEAVRITSELDGLRRAARLRRETGHDLDWDAVHSGVPGGPVPPGLHTAHTDWMAECDPAVTPERVRQAAKREARHWLAHLDPVIFDYPEELEKQAIDHVAVWSSGYANSNLAHRSFVGALTTLLSPSSGRMPRMAADDDSTCEECGHARSSHNEGPNADECSECDCSYFKSYSHEGSRRTAEVPSASSGSTCSVCGASIERDPAGEEPRTWHHNDGDKHDHEAKPSGGDSKESRFRPVAATEYSDYEVGYNDGQADIGDPRSDDELSDRSAEYVKGYRAGLNSKESRRRVATTEGDTSACSICGVAMQYFDHAWYALKASSPQRAAPQHYHVAASPGRVRPGEYNTDGTLNPGSPGGGGGKYDAPAGTIFDNGANPIKVGSRRTADQYDGQFTCPDCGEPVELVDSGAWWRHVNGVGPGPCGNKLMDVARRPDGSLTDDDPHEASRRHTAADSLREVEQYCDTLGVVMKDFPDSLIDRAAESGDMSILDTWLETHDPLTQGMWDDDAAPYSNADTSSTGYYD